MSLWSNPSEVNYFCEDHFSMAQSFENEEKDSFYEYYKQEGRRKWLSKESLELWEKIDKEKNGNIC